MGKGPRVNRKGFPITLDIISQVSASAGNLFDSRSTFQIVDTTERTWFTRDGNKSVPRRIPAATHIFTRVTDTHSGINLTQSVKPIYHGALWFAILAVVQRVREQRVKSNEDISVFLPFRRGAYENGDTRVDNNSRSEKRDREEWSYDRGKGTLHADIGVNVILEVIHFWLSTRQHSHVFSSMIQSRSGITDTGKIPVFLGYYSITFDETEMVRIPVWCYRNDVRSVDVFRYNTGK